VVQMSTILLNDKHHDGQGYYIECPSCHLGRSVAYSHSKHQGKFLKTPCEHCNYIVTVIYATPLQQIVGLPEITKENSERLTRYQVEEL